MEPTPSRARWPLFVLPQPRVATPVRRVFGSRPASFAAIGLACTAVYSVIFAALLGALAPLEANAVALLLTMIVNFAANRRVTFRGAEGRLIQQIGGYALAYGAGLAASTLALRALISLAPHATAFEVTLLGLVAGLFATAVRYALLSAWVFRVREQRNGGQ